MSFSNVDDVNDEDNVFYYTFGHTSKTEMRSKRCYNIQTPNFLDDGSTIMGDRITVTLPAANINQLCKESSVNQVSLNTTINQIIKAHLDWHAKASEAKMYYMPKPFIAKTINLLTEQQMSEIAESVVDQLFDMTLLLHGEFNHSTFMDIFDNWCRMTRTPVRYKQSEYEFKIIVMHDMGYNYSYLLKLIFHSVMEQRFLIKTNYILTDNILLIKTDGEVQSPTSFRSS